MENEQLVQLTADIVAAHVANNNVAVGDVGNLVQRVYEALAALEKPGQDAQKEEKTPIVSVRLLAGWKLTAASGAIAGVPSGRFS